MGPNPTGRMNRALDSTALRATPHGSTEPPRLCWSMKSTHRRALFVLLVAALFTLATAGCQTSKGFGQDVEKLGDKIQEKAS
jgi:predicted small secreted protein